MKNILSHRLEIIAHKVARIPLAKMVLKPVYYRYKVYLDEKRKKEFQHHALSVLDCFNKAMQEGKFDYFLIFGSLLGAVRDKGFISHDCDIDTAMWIENYSPLLHDVLKRYGFTPIFSYKIDNGESGMELSFEKDNVSIDIFFVYHPIDEYPYIVSQWSPVGNATNNLESMKKFGYIKGRRLELPLLKTTKYTQFESILLPIPSNAEEVLRFYYGEDYMKPNPKWAEDKNFVYRKDWPEKKATYKEY